MTLQCPQLPSFLYGPLYVVFRATGYVLVASVLLLGWLALRQVCPPLRRLRFPRLVRK